MGLADAVGYCVPSSYHLPCFDCLPVFPAKAFSIPEVQVENSSHGDTLQCKALRWFPRPAVLWTAHGDTGEPLPHAAITSYELNPGNITVSVVSLLHNVTANATYTCVIENSIAKAVGNIRVTGRVQHHPKTTGMGQRRVSAVFLVLQGVPAAAVSVKEGTESMANLITSFSVPG